jgi:hypothetical protein
MTFGALRRMTSASPVKTGSAENPRESLEAEFGVKGSLNR